MHMGLDMILHWVSIHALTFQVTQAGPSILIGDAYLHTPFQLMWPTSEVPYLFFVGQALAWL